LFAQSLEGPESGRPLRLAVSICWPSPVHVRPPRRVNERSDAERPLLAACRRRIYARSAQANLPPRNRPDGTAGRFALGESKDEKSP